MTATGRYRTMFTGPAAGVELPIGSRKEGNEKGQGYVPTAHILMAIKKVRTVNKVTSYSSEERGTQCDFFSLFSLVFFDLVLPFAPSPLVRRPRRSEIHSPIGLLKMRVERGLGGS